MVRYELKYSFPKDSLSYLLHTVNKHPALFSEIYPSRQINNIYFDSIDLKNYFANINGNGNREKYRIRWYGSTFGNIPFPVLEIKQKFGLVGDKKIYNLPQFFISNDFSWINLSKKINDSIFANSNPESYYYFKNLLLQKPMLINNYQRKYFSTPDKKFRLTIDWKINYLKISPNFISPFQNCDDRLIIEIKFDKQYADKADEITNFFHWRLTRNSKYVNGINTIYFKNKDF